MDNGNIDGYFSEGTHHEHSEGEERERITGQPIDLDDRIEFSDGYSVPRAILGKVNNVLVVVYTIRAMNNTDYRRIISARKADDDEIRIYEQLKEELF